MAAFRFKLDPLLELRRRTEREQQRVVADIEAECRAIEDRIRSRHEGIELSRDDLRSRLGVGETTTVHAREAAWQTHSMQRMRAEADGLVLKLSGVMKRLEQERELLIERARDRRSLERLRERREEAWKSDRARRERIELDDLASMRSGSSPLGGAQ